MTLQDAKKRLVALRELARVAAHVLFNKDAPTIAVSQAGDPRKSDPTKPNTWGAGSWGGP